MGAVSSAFLRHCFNKGVQSDKAINDYLLPFVNICLSGNLHVHAMETLLLTRVGSLIDNYIKDLQALQFFDKQAAFTQLRMCINARPPFLARCLPLERVTSTSNCSTNGKAADSHH